MPDEYLSKDVRLLIDQERQRLEEELQPPDGFSTSDVVRELVYEARRLRALQRRLESGGAAVGRRSASEPRYG